MPIGNGLYFVSNAGRRLRSDDIYFTRFKQGAWEEPQNIGCQINSTANESGPSYFEDENGHAVLYFVKQLRGRARHEQITTASISARRSSIPP